MTTEEAPRHDGPDASIDRAGARLRVLAEASHAFALVATNYTLLLEEIARIGAYLLGDGCLVTLVDADGESLVNAASAHQDPALEGYYKTYLSSLSVSKTNSQSVSAGVIRAGRARLVAEITPETIVAQSDETLRPLVARLNVHSFVVVPIRARGDVIGTLSLVRSRPGRGYTLDDQTLLEDVADRAGLAIENARLYNDLEQRVRQRTAELENVNAELETFSYSVAHDLRAPLRSIDGFTQVVLDDHGDLLGENGKKYLNRVRSAAQHMARLIDGLLDLSRISRVEIQRQRVDLSELARTVAARLREAEPGRKVEVVIAPDLAADADPRLAEVVLTNLIGNAWKFTRATANARIEFRAEGGDLPPLYLVRDNGAGFDPARETKLFAVFQRLHDADEFEGTGIGLATVRRIVHRHNGRIWAEGKVGQGATFHFTLQAA